ncbi:hypothetical protein EUTSA_v10005227mg [Eutrema salsugineum]|uniref:Uncharacterized protein n=1 Tax=Eutrema salsugineum TaxID=72664 RepID=V4KJ18_EUTSA|nr:hypothetical protein EUTSA_v10005227mg [Eutrema salsugineum]
MAQFIRCVRPNPNGDHHQKFIVNIINLYNFIMIHLRQLQLISRYRKRETRESQIHAWTYTCQNNFYGQEKTSPPSIHR